MFAYQQANEALDIDRESNQISRESNEIARQAIEDDEPATIVLADQTEFERQQPHATSFTTYSDALTGVWVNIRISNPSREQWGVEAARVGWDSGDDPQTTIISPALQPTLPVGQPAVLPPRQSTSVYIYVTAYVCRALDQSGNLSIEITPVGGGD